MGRGKGGTRGQEEESFGDHLDVLMWEGWLLLLLEVGRARL